MSMLEIGGMNLGGREGGMEVYKAPPKVRPKRRLLQEEGRRVGDMCR